MCAFQVRFKRHGKVCLANPKNNKSGSDCCNNFKYNQLMFAKWIHINLLGEF